jgi:para-nitrobenzyl esterase
MEGSGKRMIHPTVERTTRLGRVRGFARLGVETYRGLRYAEPARRFEPAVVFTSPWAGVLDATRFGAISPQGPVIPEIYGPVPDAVHAEDCLFLNIHVPQAPTPAPRPVIVFIHGGSFTGGSGNFYDGTALAHGADAVVVCINYRLGVFGAFELGWLGTERDGGGQLWLSDQITALQWVRDNIADYGGDPQRVTVIGESAGAVSVAALCASPAAEGLVHRGVACSTGYILEEPSNDVVAVIAKARKCSRDAAVNYLRTASTEALMALQTRGKRLSPRPVVNTPLLPRPMEQLIAARGENAVPMIAGYATHEGLAMELMLKAGTGWPTPLIRLVALLAANMIAAHPAKGFARRKPYLKRLRKLIGGRRLSSAFADAVWTDGFRRGAVEYLEMTKAAGSRGWLYVLDLPMRFGKWTLPSSHGIDVALTFNVGDDPEATVPPFVDLPDATLLSRRWVRMLGHFARHGEPGDALGDWPVYEAPSRTSLFVDADGCRLTHDLEAPFREQVWREGRGA